MKFDFPGNIRQLKNIVEQISVLELEKEINTECLNKYLPEAIGSRFPILYSGQKEENLSEREILYKVLFDMKRDMSDLKNLVLDVIQSGDTSDLSKRNELLVQKFCCDKKNCYFFQNIHVFLT